MYSDDRPINKDSCTAVPVQRQQYYYNYLLFYNNSTICMQVYRGKKNLREYLNVNLYYINIQHITTIIRLYIHHIVETVYNLLYIIYSDTIYTHILVYFCNFCKLKCIENNINNNIIIVPLNISITIILYYFDIIDCKI